MSKFSWLLLRTSGLNQKSDSYKVISHSLPFICNHQNRNQFIFSVSRTFAKLVVFEKLLCVFRKWRHYTVLNQNVALVTIILNVARVVVTNSVYKTKKIYNSFEIASFQRQKKINSQKISQIFDFFDLVWACSRLLTTFLSNANDTLCLKNSSCQVSSM